MNNLPIMAQRNNFNNQRGTPAQSQQARRPRQRDLDRMRNFNEVRHNQQYGEGGGWANQIANEEAYEEASNRGRRPPPRTGSGIPPRPQTESRGNRRPPRRNAPVANPSTVETPARDEPLYSGNNRGSKPVKKTLAQNFDYAGFIPLVRQTYDRMAIEDQQISRKLPYAIFQHAMVEFLVAHQLQQAKYVLKSPTLQNSMDPLAVISANEFNIPVPIFDYICGLGPTITPSGDKVYWNIPECAIPSVTRTFNHHTVRSGSFGPINAQNHNVYECYISPYITSEYIVKTGEVNSQTRSLEWNPLPAGWFPTNGIANENLLGYRSLQRLHPDGMRKCIECDFYNSDDVAGMLCHSAYVMTLTSGYLGSLSTIKVTKADFTTKDNSAAFIFKERCGESDALAVLWDEPATLKSPFAFSAAASNRANYSAFKRKRDPDIPGTCYTVAGTPPVEWLPTINNNFLVNAPFSLQRGFRDRPSLRSNDHEEEEGSGTVTQDVFNWLETSFITKR